MRMDEILIGEKKYVSSKQAAKVTGYAKDYIGQLCREGRVPARLVGRSWYVLESAIHDHRFGEPKNEPVEELKKPVSTALPLNATWESPRYEASDTEVLPSVNRLRDREEPEFSDDKRNDLEVAQRLQDTWAAWFDRFDKIADTQPVAPVAPKEPEVESKEDKEPEAKETEAVRVPIRAVRQPYHQASMEELLSRNSDIQPLEDRQEGRTFGRKLVRSLQLSGAVLATATAVVAVMGSGYLDSYILSNSQARMIAGIELYNK